MDVLKDLKKGGRAYAVILVDIERLEDTVTQLEAQRNQLNEQLSRSTLSCDRVERLKQFAAKISKGLETARKDFNLRKAIIDLLAIQVKLIREDSRLSLT